MRLSSHQSPPLSVFAAIGLLLVVAISDGCNSGPGAGIRRPSYPALTQSTRTYNWLVLKCQLSDAPDIPTGLDTKIQQFFGITGAGYGNIIDYFHDVSYNHASVVSDTTIGWIKAPFNKASLQSGGSLAPSSARAQRVSLCLNAVPATQLPDLSQFYGVVVMTNVVQDGGACGTGQIPTLVNNKTFQLACVWFDPKSLYTAFAAQEIAHGLGLVHSFDDSQNDCDGSPGEYCDPWDIMSALGTYYFTDPNWPYPTQPGYAGPGLSAPGLILMNWLPANNLQFYPVEQGGEQTYTIHALSHPRAGVPMVVIINIPSLGGVSQFATVEYRQSDGWDAGFPKAPGATNGGVVLVHRGNSSSNSQLSMLIENRKQGQLQPCGRLIFNFDNRIVFHVTAESFNFADGSAVVSMGFGTTGKFVYCPGTVVTSPGGVIFQKP